MTQETSRVLGLILLLVALIAIIYSTDCRAQSDYEDGRFDGRMNFYAEDDRDSDYYAGFVEGRDERWQEQLEQWRYEDERRYDEMIDEINDAAAGRDYD